MLSTCLRSKGEPDLDGAIQSGSTTHLGQLVLTQKEFGVKTPVDTLHLHDLAFAIAIAAKEHHPMHP